MRNVISKIRPTHIALFIASVLYLIAGTAEPTSPVVTFYSVLRTPPAAETPPVATAPVGRDQDRLEPRARGSPARGRATVTACSRPFPPNQRAWPM